MKENRIFSKKNPSEYFKKILEETLREGAGQLLQQALENFDNISAKTRLHASVELIYWCLVERFTKTFPQSTLSFFESFK